MSNTHQPLLAANLPSEGFLRLKQVLQVIPVGKSTWWAGCRSGRFPRAVKIGHLSVWRAEDIRALMQKISEGSNV